MKGIVKWLVAASIAAALSGCGVNGDGVEPYGNNRQEMLDEREDRTLNDPATEYRIEQMEDRMENRNANGLGTYWGNGVGNRNGTNGNGGMNRVNGGM